MKICLITLYTPLPENIGGISAHPYYLMVEREKDIDIEIFSFNLNQVKSATIKEVEKTLNVKIHLLQQPKWYKFIVNHHLTFIRVFLKYTLDSYIKPSKSEIKKICRSQPDLIWRYGYNFINLTKELPQYKHIVSDPDCPSMTMTRLLADVSSYTTIIKFLAIAKLAYSYYNTTKSDSSPNVLHHLVGFGDYDLQRQIIPQKKSFFILHPHYQLSQAANISFNHICLHVLIAGKNDMYMSTGMKLVAESLKAMNDRLKQRFDFTFLGKGWEKLNEDLNNSGITCKIITWADNYVDEIAKYDIQLVPITVGSGTKAKVIDALANGLLVIGTECALENIAVRNMESCVCYKYADQIPSILSSIISNIAKYEQIAKKGMEQARLYHAPKRISKRFFDISKEFLKS